MHLQRELEQRELEQRELEQLYNKLDHTPHGTQCYSTTQTPGDPPAAARTGAAVQ
jgi:hypothetical protein